MDVFLAQLTTYGAALGAMAWTAKRLAASLDPREWFDK